MGSVVARSPWIEASIADSRSPQTQTGWMMSLAADLDAAYTVAPLQTAILIRSGAGVAQCYKLGKGRLCGLSLPREEQAAARALAATCIDAHTLDAIEALGLAVVPAAWLDALRLRGLDYESHRLRHARSEGDVE